MNFIFSIIVFMLFMFGLFILANLSLEDLSVGLDESLHPVVAIKKQAYRKQKNKKQSFLLSILQDTKLIMASMGRSSKFIVVIIVSVVLSIVSGFISTMLGNPFLIPAFTIGALSIPFIFVRTYSYTYQNSLRNELELSLSQITTSYIRTDDIIRAVEENINNINNPVREVFSEFLSQVKYINPNIRDGIDVMEEKIDNYIFREWCEALKKCIQNRTLKYMLMPVVNKFSTLREIQGSIKEALTGYKFEFYIIVGIVYGNYPLIWFMEEEWYKVLTSTTQGLACTGLIALITVICFIIFSFIIKPIDYEV